MIYDNIEFLTPLQNTILQLKLSYQNFWLTGDRFFQETNVDSDWEFIAKSTPEVEAYLFYLGFKENKDAETYFDYMTSDIFTKSFCSCENSSEKPKKINIQLVNDPVLKCRVRDIIKQRYLDEYLSSSTADRIKIWNTVCSAVTTVGV